MPHRRAIRLSVGVCLFGVLAGNIVQAAVTRIMPLGDSITAGDAIDGGYRGPLYQMLASSGYAVDFVGSQTGGDLPDPNHEGHPGWLAGQIRDSVTYWLMANPADIVLLHIGTNDIAHGGDVAGTAAAIGQILDKIDAYETTSHATITVILARIINRSNPQDALGIETSELNVSIASMAASRIAAGDHLVVVDQEAALSYPADLVDTEHPNANGYGKMAVVWFDALTPLFDNKGDFVSDTIPTTMIPGLSYDCSVTMHNSGYQPWLCWPAGTMLTVGQFTGSVANKLIPYPYDQIYSDPCRIDVGQNCTFPFTINVSADTPLGQYEITWQMKDNNEWFDSNGHNAVFRKSVALRLHPVYRGDFDDDADVDQEDFGFLQKCLSDSPAVQDCGPADLNADGYVDQSDVDLFQPCMVGANQRPGC